MSDATMNKKTMPSWAIRIEGDRTEVALGEVAMPEPGANQLLVLQEGHGILRRERLAEPR